MSRGLWREARTTEAICNLVAAGLGVSIIGPAFPGVEIHPRVVARPFEPAIHGDLALLYLRQKKLARIPQAFVDVVEAYVEANFQTAKVGRRARS